MSGRLWGLLSFIAGSAWAWAWEFIRSLFYERGSHMLSPYFSTITLDQVLHWGPPLILGGVGIWLFWKTRQRAAAALVWGLNEVKGRAYAQEGPPMTQDKSGKNSPTINAQGNVTIGHIGDVNHGPPPFEVKFRTNSVAPMADGRFYHKMEVILEGRGPVGLWTITPRDSHVKFMRFHFTRNDQIYEIDYAPDKLSIRNRKDIEIAVVTDTPEKPNLHIEIDP